MYVCDPTIYRFLSKLFVFELMKRALLYTDTLLAYAVHVSLDSTRPEYRIEAPLYRYNSSPFPILSTLNSFRPSHNAKGA
jgi:hypothetical protein